MLFLVRKIVTISARPTATWAAVVMTKKMINSVFHRYGDRALTAPITFAGPGGRAAHWPSLGIASEHHHAD
jgi:hypothetical protein